MATLKVPSFPRDIRTGVWVVPTNNTVLKYLNEEGNIADGNEVTGTPLKLSATNDNAEAVGMLAVTD